MMKKLYQTLKTLPKTRPHFNPKLIMLKCLEFMVKAIQGKYGDETPEAIPWWYNYRAVDTRLSENNTIEYQPKYHNYDEQPCI